MKINPSAASREARNRARERLAKLGHNRKSLTPAVGLMQAIEYELGAERNCSPEEWVRRYLALSNPPVVQPRDANKLKVKAYQPSAQWQINVERARKAQPPRWTPDGIGNGAERQHGYGRGA